ncbi:MAG: hypothetical protein ACE5J2_03550 [Nitrososphaerales archaeon]
MKRQKKGVAGIIGGVFLAAILFTSGVIFFISITQGENIRSKGELEAQAYKNDKLLEVFEIRSLADLTDDDEYIQIQLNNTGPIPMTASYLTVYDENSIPLLQGTPLIGGNPLTINPALSEVINTGDIDDNITFLSDPPEPYRIDIISERGNIQSTLYPPPPPFSPGALSEALEDCDDCTSAFAGFAGAAGESVLAQNTGSIILNYTTLGLIFPNQAARDGIDQAGWEINVKAVDGYPAFRLPAEEETYLTMRVRNRDASGMDFHVMHQTGIVLTMSSGSNFNQVTGFICKIEMTSRTLSQYDNSDPIVLPNVYGDPDPEAGWRSLTFCDLRMESYIFEPKWQPDTSNLSFFFLIIRAEYENEQPYAQTIPYQAVLVTDKLSSSAGSAFFACVKSQGSPQKCDKSADDKNQGSPGETVDVNIYSDEPYPFSAAWIYPDNTFTKLGEITSGDTLTVNIPTRMPDPSNPDCDIPTDPDDPDCLPIASGYYTIVASDAEDNIMYITYFVE